MHVERNEITSNNQVAQLGDLKIKAVECMTALCCVVQKQQNKISAHPPTKRLLHEGNIVCRCPQPIVSLIVVLHLCWNYFLTNQEH